MSNYNLVSSKDHSKNFAHFSALVFIAQIDGHIDNKELELLKGFAEKLGIEDNEYSMIMENPAKYPIQKTSIVEKRLRHLYEMFQIIFTDHDIDATERKMICQYAVELGFSSSYSEDLIDRSIELFRGNFSFNNYSTFVEKKY